MGVKKVLIHCDNAAVVCVLRSGKTRDPYLGACACNVWYVAATSDIDLQYTHIRGVDNKVADALSKWQGTDQWQLLGLHVVHPVWLQVSHELLELDPELSLYPPEAMDLTSLRLRRRRHSV